MRRLLLATLWFVVAFHFLIVFLVTVSFFVLPFKAPWYVATPVMVYISYLLTTRVECPLTNLENVLRKELGMKRIGGFVGHYIYRPLFRRKRQEV